MVYVVQSINYTDDGGQFTALERIFSAPEIAEKWIENEILRVNNSRDTKQRAEDIRREWVEENPFKFSEGEAPKAPKLSSALGIKDLPPEQRAIFDAQVKARQEYYVRYGQEQLLWSSKMEEHLVAVWAKENRKGDPLHLPYASYRTPTYEVIELPVFDTAEM